MAYNYILGLFRDEEILMDSIKKIRSEGIGIHDVITPFPVHGLEKVMGLKPSRLHIAGFFYGLFGTTFAFSFITWVFTSNWPLNFGGKPFFSFPAFIPIMFEFTVLCSAIGMTLTYCIRNGIYPGKLRETLDPRLTDDMFGIVFNTHKKSSSELERIKNVLSETGAVEIKERELKRTY